MPERITEYKIKISGDSAGAKKAMQEVRAEAARMADNANVPKWVRTTDQYDEGSLAAMRKFYKAQEAEAAKIRPKPIRTDVEQAARDEMAQRLRAMREAGQVERSERLKEQAQRLADERMFGKQIADERARQRSGEAIRNPVRTEIDQATRDEMAARLRQKRSASDKERSDRIKAEAQRLADVEQFGEKEASRLQRVRDGIPIRKPIRTDVEQAARDEMAQRLRAMREAGQVERSERLKEQAKRIADERLFGREIAEEKARQRKEQAAKEGGGSQWSESVELKHIGHMLRGGGQLLGAKLISEAFANFGEGFEKFMNDLREGKKQTGEIAEGLVQQVPVLGQMEKGWAGIREGITGAKAAAEQLAKVDEAIGASLEKKIQLLKEEEVVRRQNANKIKDAQDQSVLAGMTGLPAKEKKIELELESKKRQIGDETTDQSTAIKKKWDDENSKLYAEEKKIQEALPNARNQHREDLKARQAQIQSITRSNIQRRNQEVEENEAAGKTRIRAAEETAAKERNRLDAERDQYRNSQIIESTQRTGQARIEALRAQGKELESEQSRIEAERDAKYREIELRRKAQDEADPERKAEHLAAADKETAAVKDTSIQQLQDLQRRKEEIIRQGEQEMAAVQAEGKAQRLKEMGQGLQAELVLTKEAYDKKIADINQREKEALRLGVEDPAKIKARAEAERQVASGRMGADNNAAQAADLAQRRQMTMQFLGMQMDTARLSGAGQQIGTKMAEATVEALGKGYKLREILEDKSGRYTAGEKSQAQQWMNYLPQQLAMAQAQAVRESIPKVSLDYQNQQVQGEAGLYESMRQSFEAKNDTEYLKDMAEGMKGLSETMKNIQDTIKSWQVGTA